MSNVCRYCNHDKFSQHPGKGPHAGELKCKKCGRHHRWMSKGEIAAPKNRPANWWLDEPDTAEDIPF